MTDRSRLYAFASDTPYFGALPPTVRDRVRRELSSLGRPEAELSAEARGAIEAARRILAAHEIAD